MEQPESCRTWHGCDCQTSFLQRLFQSTRHDMQKPYILPDFYKNCKNQNIGVANAPDKQAWSTSGRTFVFASVPATWISWMSQP